MRTDQQPAQTGFTLIEALIALVIIMVGLLGIAGLQALGVRNSAQAHVRSLASSDAKSLAADLRSNSAYWSGAGAVQNLKVTWTGSGLNYDQAAFTSAPDCATTNCSPAQTAAYSVRQWAQSLSDLPAGAFMKMTVLATNGDFASTYRIQVTWPENGMNGQGATQAASSSMHSTRVVVKP